MGELTTIETRITPTQPFHAGQVWHWLAMHAVPGIEELDQGRFRRSVRLGSGPGVVEAEPDEIEGDNAGSVLVRFHLTDPADAEEALAATVRLLDTAAPSDRIDDTLGADSLLGPLVEAAPGVRSPGEANPEDSVVRAILHQQVSLASARGITARLVERHGARLAHPIGGVNRVFPGPEVWAELDPADLGMPRRRAETLVTTAAAVAAGDVVVGHGSSEDGLAALLACNGIGPWTTAIVALRGWGDPDVFCTGDLALERVAGDLGIEDGLASVVDRWRPWRSYAMHHLWRSYTT